ncbi:Cytochrome [Zancudomyces culisetae]|uniref:Cytochrome n=1 Tax=Zancudomyces culisetae TaxID=1213189 RepID=A0A1R1PDN9_ZANCU|nr:Cytochrome [Zancudomyces culisetae]|eukprot:OMH79028.1 Cytochrome [Zancudomyces culisetae]
MQRGREGTVKVRKLEDVMMDDKVAKNVASRKKGGKGFINLPEYVESYEFNDGVFTVTIPTGEKLFVVGITNKKLVQTIKGFVSDPAISSNYNWTKEAFFKYKFIRGNYLTKYLETAVMLRTNHPKHTLPRDLVQFLASNKEWFDHKDAHIISYSLLLVIRSGVYLSTVKLHSVLTELSLRKDVLLELRKEQEDIMSKYGSDLKYAHLDQMIYLDAFIKEVFRLSASAKNLLRRATADITLSNGVVIPKGGYSTFNMHSYNRMHSLFGKNSREFDYKRHVRAGASLSDCSPYNLVWSAGPRICVAREYAVAISKTIMAILIRNYSIENLLKPPKGCEYTPLDFKLGSFGLYLERLNGQKNKSKHKTKGVTRQNRVIFEE